MTTAATLAKRIEALERGRDGFEILNPRAWELTPEHEAANRQRINEARREGRPIIIIPNSKRFHE